MLKQCGDDLTRENVIKQAANLKDFRTEVLLPGIKINTSPTDFAAISDLQLMRFKGEKWELFGDVISGRLVEPINDVHFVVGEPDAKAHAVHPATARPRRGSRTVNSVKSPTSLSTVIVPPCCCVTIS